MKSITFLLQFHSDIPSSNVDTLFSPTSPPLFPRVGENFMPALQLVSCASLFKYTALIQYQKLTKYYNLAKAGFLGRCRKTRQNGEREDAIRGVCAWLIDRLHTVNFVSSMFKRASKRTEPLALFWLWYARNTLKLKSCEKVTTTCLHASICLYTFIFARLGYVVFVFVFSYFTLIIRYALKGIWLVLLVYLFEAGRSHAF